MESVNFGGHCEHCAMLKTPHTVILYFARLYGIGCCAATRGKAFSLLRQPADETATGRVEQGETLSNSSTRTKTTLFEVLLSWLPAVASHSTDCNCDNLWHTIMAAERIDKLYEDAVASGLLPGVSVIAGDKSGK